MQEVRDCSNEQLSHKRLFVSDSCIYYKIDPDHTDVRDFAHHLEFSIKEQAKALVERLYDIARDIKLCMGCGTKRIVTPTVRVGKALIVAISNTGSEDSQVINEDNHSQAHKIVVGSELDPHTFKHIPPAKGQDSLQS